MRTVHYKTLKGFMHANDVRQFSLERFLNGTIYKPGVGTIRFKLSEEAEDEFIRGITGVIWSRVTEEKMTRVRRAKSMGILHRLWYNGKHYEYCAGQDYEAEIRYIQRHI